MTVLLIANHSIKYMTSSAAFQFSDYKSPVPRLTVVLASFERARNSGPNLNSTNGISVRRVAIRASSDTNQPVDA